MQNVEPGLFEGVGSFSALHVAVRGKRNRNRPAVGAFLVNLEKEILKLKRELAGGRYRPGRYRTTEIVDLKRRMVSAAPFRDRVVHHCHIVNIRGTPTGCGIIRTCCRLGSTPQEERAVIANQNGNGDGRPLWITGSPPPDSWRSLRQPGYPQLDRVRQPKYRAYRPDHTPEVSNFRLGLTARCKIPTHLTAIPAALDGES